MNPWEPNSPFEIVLYSDFFSVWSSRLFLTLSWYKKKKKSLFLVFHFCGVHLLFFETPWWRLSLSSYVLYSSIAVCHCRAISMVFFVMCILGFLQNPFVPFFHFSWHPIALDFITAFCFLLSEPPVSLLLYLMHLCAQA